MRLFRETVAAAAAILFIGAAHAATVVVNQPDSFDAPAGGGACTLVRAIKLINAGTDIYATNHECTFTGLLGDQDTIQFNFPPGPPTPVVVTNDGVAFFNLPSIAKPVTIDGAGFMPKTEIIAGAGATGPAFDIESSQVTLRNLAIGGFGPAMIDIGATAPNLFMIHIEGCNVGTDLFGMTARPGSGGGIRIQQGTDITVGGFTPTQRNVISGNADYGVLVQGTNTFVAFIQGNYIGVGFDGAMALPNCTAAISCGGVVVTGGAHEIDVGAPFANGRNVISSNAGDGIRVVGTGAPGGDPQNIHILGNYIGVAADGVSARGNVGAVPDPACGVRVSALMPLARVDVGGSAAGAGNVIANNLYCGVIALQGATATIEGNSIHDNTSIGIDLSATPPGDGPTANDANGHLVGPNKYQNFPVLASAIASVDGTTFTASGTLSSPNTPNAPIRVELFTSTPGSVQGARYAGFVQVTTDGSGLATFSGGPFTATAGQSRITATASSINGTSEFSVPLTLVNDLVFTDGFE